MKKAIVVELRINIMFISYKDQKFEMLCKKINIPNRKDVFMFMLGSLMQKIPSPYFR